MANHRDSVPVWTDFAEALAAWQEELGADIVVELHTCVVRGRADLYAEIKVFDQVENPDRIVNQVRQPLNVRKLGAPLKNLLYGAFLCFEQIYTAPWLWTHKMRRERVQLD